MYTFSFSFFWDGEERTGFFNTEDNPLDEVKISALIYGAIKLWFISQKIPLPEIVRNIKIDDGKVYHWNSLKLKG